MKDLKYEWAEESPGLCVSVRVCIAATAKDSVFHNGGTLNGEKALKGKDFNLCISLCFGFLK